MEEGKPFCPQCSAPQIRVIGAEPPASAPSPYSEFNERHVSTATTLQPQPIDWVNAALPSAAWAGLVAALIMIVPLGAFGFGMLAGGWLAVVLYRRRVPNALITPGMGAKLGAASGAIGYGILVVLLALSLVFLHTGNELRQALTQAIQQAIARSSDPGAKEALQALQSPQGVTIVLIFAFILMFCIYLIVASIGGALSAVLLRPKKSRK